MENGNNFRDTAWRQAGLVLMLRLLGLPNIDPAFMERRRAIPWLERCGARVGPMPFQVWQAGSWAEAGKRCQDETVLPVYEAGHFPCGWTGGKWPSGTLVVW